MNKKDKARYRREQIDEKAEIEFIKLYKQEAAIAPHKDNHMKLEQYAKQTETTIDDFDHLKDAKIQLDKLQAIKDTSSDLCNRTQLQEALRPIDQGGNMADLFECDVIYQQPKF